MKYVPGPPQVQVGVERAAIKRETIEAEEQLLLLRSNRLLSMKRWRAEEDELLETLNRLAERSKIRERADEPAGGGS